ncbi:MAG: DUF1593 domain-containing protein [Opitutaceae bacterium]|nr:DUF1593 domain-containing protein [Opitutaceae bacterium]
MRRDSTWPRWACLAAAAISWCICGTGVHGANAAERWVDTRPRLLLLSDYFKDPDDKQSFIRLLVYANEFTIEGLIATSLAYGDGSVRPDLLREQIAQYRQVLPMLRQHERPGYEYPSAEALTALVRSGAPVIRTRARGGTGFPVPWPEGARDSRASDPAELWIADGQDTEASEHIISIVDRDDARPVWITVWGGAMDLARAINKVRRERSAEAVERFIAKVRLCQNSWQDTGTVWLWKNVPELFFIQFRGMGPAMYGAGDPALADESWVRRNILVGHGPLGAGYPPANAAGKTELRVKEGDTPTFLYLLSARGLSSLEHPEWGGWGGRFFRVNDGANRHFAVAEDAGPNLASSEGRERWTLARWQQAIANEFASRMDWCVKSRTEANHAPIAVVNGDDSTEVIHMNATAGERIVFDAGGSSDPDGDRLHFHWWQYREAGTYPGMVALHHGEPGIAQLVAPTAERGQTVHLILEVKDEGEPALTSYRRIVLSLQPATSGKGRK